MPKNVKISILPSKKASKKRPRGQVPRATVNLRVNPAPMPKVSGKSKQAPRNMPLSDDAAQWKLALTDPFDSRAVGVRQADMFYTDTTPYSFRNDFTLSTAGGGSLTNGVCAFGPHPMQPLVACTNFNTGSTVDPVIGANSAKAYTFNTQAYHLTTPATLNTVMNNFRIVAGGLKVTIDEPPLVATGNWLFAPVPISESGFGYNSLEAGNTVVPGSAGAHKLLYGMNPSGLSLGSMRQLPGFFELSTTELVNKELILPFRPVSPQYQQFNTTNDGTAVGGQTIISSANAVTATGLVVTSASDIEGLNDARGWNAWIIGYENAPVPSNGQQPLITVQWVCHAEGTPTVGTLTTGAVPPIPDAPPCKNVGWSDADRVLQMVELAPWATVRQAATVGRGLIKLGRMAAM